MSQDPFSDNAKIDVPDSGYFERYDCLSPFEARKNKTAHRPEKIAVPILDVLSPLTQWSCSSDLSTQPSSSTAPTLPSNKTTSNPIQWKRVDLMYLLSILYPSLLLTDRLLFSPPLENLCTPTHIRLYQKTHSNPPPSEAYSAHAPIGTGRSYSRMLLADSGPRATLAQAQRALAHALLSDTAAVNHALNHFNVLSALHSLPTDTLRSVYSGVQLMARVSDVEWNARWRHLRGWCDGGWRVQGVDERCGVEARLEVFFLSAGREGLRAWAERIGVVNGLGEGERRAWSGVYGEAAGFLARAVGEMRA